MGIARLISFKSLLTLFARKSHSPHSCHDPLDYNSTTRRLYRAENYCVYNAGFCYTTSIGYNSTTRRLYKMNESTIEGQRCPNYVDIDTTARRLKNYTGFFCGVT